MYAWFNFHTEKISQITSKHYVNQVLWFIFLHLHYITSSSSSQKGLLTIITSLYENLIRIAQMEFAGMYGLFPEQIQDTFKRLIGM